jgi:hypothetical protein
MPIFIVSVARSDFVRPRIRVGHLYLINEVKVIRVWLNWLLLLLMMFLSRDNHNFCVWTDTSQYLEVLFCKLDLLIIFYYLLLE